MVKYTTVVNGEITTLELTKENFRELMEVLKRRARRNKLERRKKEIMKKW